MCIQAPITIPTVTGNDASADGRCPFSRALVDLTAGGPEIEAIGRELNGSLVTQAGAWGRALMLQLAHPYVASAVADHGYLLSDPESGWPRLVRTLEVIQCLMAGTPEEALRTARQLHFVHSGVKGSVAGCGGTGEGATYSALDPELLRWVYATLIDSILRSHETFVRPLTTAEKDAYCLASHRLGRLVGMREADLPRSAAELRDYMERTIEGDELAVTEAANLLVERLSDAPLPRFVRPLRRFAMLAGMGQLPPGLRAAYRTPWGWRRRLVFGICRALTRLLHPLLPRLSMLLYYVARSNASGSAAKDPRWQAAPGLGPGMPPTRARFMAHLTEL